MGILRIGRKEERGQKKSQELVGQNIAPLAKDQLGISEEAALHIDKLIGQMSEDKKYFRVAIKGGGCSGLSLHFEFCQDKRAQDLVFSHHKAQVIIDQKSLSILGGATLHLREYLGTYEFILVNNPAEKQCSCGKSFSL